MNVKAASTWSVHFIDDLPKWLARYQRVYSFHGYTPDDAVQEGHVALLTCEGYLNARYDALGSVAAVAALARVIATRHVHRAFLGRAANGKQQPDFLALGTPGALALDEPYSREHAAHVSLEMAELIETCGQPDVKMYLTALMNGEIAFDLVTPERNDRIAKAGTYVLGRMSRYKWSHE